MIPSIAQSIIDECKAFIQEDPDFLGATVIFHTDFDFNNVPSYTMPLIIIEVNDAPESGQFIGGVQHIDWIINLNVYNFEPSPTEDDSNFSTGLLIVMDKIRNHFLNEMPLAQSFIDMIDNYGFNYVLSGIQEAPELEKDNVLLMGKRIGFDSIGIDTDTNQYIDVICEYIAPKN